MTDYFFNLEKGIKGLAVFLTCLVLTGASCFADAGNTNVLPQDLKGVGVTEHINNPLPLNAVVIDSQGQKKTFKDYVNNGRPKILVFAYYTCPMLCGLVLDGAAQVVKDVPGAGEKYDILTVSIDPEDTVQSAADYEKKYNKAIGKPEGIKSWHFLLGYEGSAKQLADAAGFGYSREPNGEYAHTSLIMVLSADGRMMRYLYGIQPRPFDLKLALAEAKSGHGVSSVERVLLFCYNYDPNSRGYVLFAVKLMRIGALITVVLLAGVLVWLARTSQDRKS